MPPKENRDDRNAKRPANTGNVRAGRCYVRGMITLTLLCRKKSVYLGFRASHIPMPSVAEDLGGGGGGYSSSSLLGLSAGLASNSIMELE
jgi:hypothetical protein